MELTKEQIMSKNFVEIAVQIQDACNPIAVTAELREAMMKARYSEVDPRKDIAVKAIFFKLYDMMGALTVQEMYEALMQCEKLISKEG